MGTIIRGVSNKVANVYQSERGDLEFRILGKGAERFTPVAGVFYTHTSSPQGKEFINKTMRAFAEYFASPPYQDILLAQLRKRKTSPQAIWRKVKKHYHLPSDYDTDSSKLRSP